MYAVIKSGGKQHRVVADELLRVELLKAEKGETIKFEDEENFIEKMKSKILRVVNSVRPISVTHKK